MKQITVLSQPTFLLHYQPNWDSSFDCEFSIINDSDRGLTGREERVPLSTTLRTGLTFDLLLRRQQAAEFRAALKALGNTPVLCPFWPASSWYHADKTFYVGSSGKYFTAADGSFYISGETNAVKTARLSSGLMLCYEPDWSAFSVYAASGAPSFTPSTVAVKVPLLWGRFSKPPVPEAVTDELLSATVEFVENSPVELAFTSAALAFAAGPEAAGQVRNLFPLRPDWRDGIRFGEVSVDITTDEIGYGRQTADTFYPQSSARIAEQNFLCKSWADVHSLIRFFQDCAGTIKNFWLPSFIGDCRLNAPATAGTDFITVDQSEGLGESSHLALINRTGIEPHAIDALDTGTNIVLLADQLTSSFSPADTLVSPLLLARFGKASIKISFETDEIARASLRFIEVPEEYASIEGDESGAQVKTAFLYRFTLSGFDPWLFTSHESAITHGADIYAPAHFDHGAIKENINLEKNELIISSRYFWHPSDVSLRNPLGYFLPFRLESPLQIEILECAPDADGDIGSADTLFSGQIITASFDGPKISAKCRSIGSIFDRQIPTILIQPTCNFALYSTACGINSDVWKMSATVVSYDGAHSLIIGQPVFVDQQAVRPDTVVFEHFFAGGKLEAGNGDSFTRRGILDSIANGENIKLSIRHPIETAPEAVFLWPGCDGRRETCLAYHADDNPDGKFNNFTRFGGFPFSPAGNPTLTKLNRDYENSGKK